MTFYDKPCQASRRVSFISVEATWATTLLLRVIPVGMTLIKLIARRGATLACVRPAHQL